MPSPERLLQDSIGRLRFRLHAIGSGAVGRSKYVRVHRDDLSRVLDHVSPKEKP